MGAENERKSRDIVAPPVPEHNSEIPAASENVEGLPEKFQAVVVLGKNWRERPPKNTQGKWKLHLSIESKMSAIAAGEMYTSGLATKILFSGGRTVGADWPSEAGAMQEFLKKKYPDIPDDDIMLEEEAIDTIDSAERVDRILQEHGFQDIALLTVGFHISRSEKIFQDRGIAVHGLPSEEMLKKRSLHYEQFVGNFLASKRVRMEQWKEKILRGLLVIDTKGKIPRMVTQRIRGGA